MSVFTVDTEAVVSTTQTVNATGERLHAESSAMMAQLTQLQSSWTGAAAVAFQECTEQWRAAHAHLEQVLSSISVAMNSAASQYADAENFSASLFR